MELKECQRVDPQRLWEAVSDWGWIQKWLLFQLQLLAASYFVHPAFWLAWKVLLRYSRNALCNGLTTIFGKAFTFTLTGRNNVNIVKNRVEFDNAQGNIIIQSRIYIYKTKIFFVVDQMATITVAIATIVFFLWQMWLLLHRGRTGSTFTEPGRIRVFKEFQNRAGSRSVENVDTN